MIKSLILALIWVSVAACNDGHQTPQENRMLRYDIPAPVGSLNPLDAKNSGATFIHPFLFSYLCVPDETGDLKPDLAVTWNYDPSELKWTIEIRKNVRFHDGTPVTAGDVNFSIQSAFAGPRKCCENPIKKIDILSSTRINITLNKNDPEFLNKIWDMSIVPEHKAGSGDFVNHPIGSGPFKFKSRRGDQSVELVANDDYYAGKTLLEGATFFYQQDKEKSWTRLLAGETDIAHEITPKNYRMMADIKNRFHFNTYTLPWYSILLYNTNDPLFSDVRVRQALTHAINRPGIVETMLNGYGKVAIGPMGIDNAFRNPKLSPMPYDPQKALDLLRDAGWSLDKSRQYLQKDGKPFEFTILCFKEGFVPVQAARSIVLDLNEVGMKAHIKLLPYEELCRRYVENNQFQAVLTEFGTSQRKPEEFEKLWTPLIDNVSVAGCFEDTEVTRLVRLLASENDPEKAKALCHQIDARIAFLQPGTFLYHKTVFDVMSARISFSGPFSLTQSGASRLWRATIR